VACRSANGASIATSSSSTVEPPQTRLRPNHCRSHHCGWFMDFARALPFVVVTIIVVSAGPASAAPSFNCKKATALVEKQICGNPDFEPIDRDIASLYTRSLAVLSKSDSDALRAEQRAWVKERDQCEDMIHGDPPIMADVLQCMRKTMGERKTRLQAIFE